MKNAGLLVIVLLAALAGGCKLTPEELAPIRQGIEDAVVKRVTEAVEAKTDALVDKVAKKAGLSDEMAAKLKVFASDATKEIVGPAVKAAVEPVLKAATDAATSEKGSKTGQGILGVLLALGNVALNLTGFRKPDGGGP